MRLTFIPDDALIILNGVPAVVDLQQLEVPDGLHAIQHYEDGYTEVEWKDERDMAIGNSIGCSGLPSGEGYLSALADLHERFVTTSDTTQPD